MKQKGRRERSPLSASVLAILVGIVVSLLWAVRLVVELNAYHRYHVIPHDSMFDMYMLIHGNQSGEIYQSPLFQQFQAKLDLQDLLIGTMVPTLAAGIAFGKLVSPRVKAGPFLAWAAVTVLGPWALSQIFILLVEYFRTGHIDLSRYPLSWIEAQATACAIWLVAGLIGAGLGRAFNRAPKTPPPSARKPRRAAAAGR